ncbi:DNA-binding transcriptional activator GcvA [compost metagenome]
MHDDLVTGRLVPVLPKSMVRARYDYYLVALPEKAERPAVAAFREWLLAEGRSFMAATAGRSAFSGSATR